MARCRAQNCNSALPRPSLVLLDLNLPKKSGDEVLKDLRNSIRCRHARC